MKSDYSTDHKRPIQGLPMLRMPPLVSPPACSLHSFENGGGGELNPESSAMPPCYQESQGVVSLLLSAIGWFWVRGDTGKSRSLSEAAWDRSHVPFPPSLLFQQTFLAGHLWAGVLRDAEPGASNTFCEMESIPFTSPRDASQPHS